jgi:Icc-related predicted phosphoesterase
MKVVCISDTHTEHGCLTIPACDLLIHAGDFTYEGNFCQVRDFCQWFASQTQAKHRVVIAGNHELGLDPNCGRQYNAAAYGMIKDDDRFIYLENSTTIIEGYKIWGCPWTPRFFDWAFNATREEDETFERGPSLKAIYNTVPTDTDIIVCHGPPYNILDKNIEGENVGSKEMIDVLRHRNVKLYICGHLHEGRGIVEKDGTIFVNASSLDRGYNLYPDPITIIEL